MRAPLQAAIRPPRAWVAITAAHRPLLPLGLGVAVLAVIWLGPLPEMGSTAFSPHMLTHLGVVALAAPLIGIALGNALPAARAAQLSTMWPVFASLLEFAAVYGWHIPAAHAAAATALPYFVAEQASYVTTATLVWFLAFAGRSRASAAAGVLAFFMVHMHMSILGIFLLLAPEVLYPADVCQGAFGLPPLDDQRFGGILMMGWGGIVYLSGGLFLAWRMLAPGRGD